MRIIHILNHTFTCNGNVNVAIDLACIQSRMGHQVLLISGGGDFNEVLAENNVEHLVIDFTRKPILLLKALWQLRKGFHAFQPEIVHAHMMTAAMLSSLLRPLFVFKLITTVHNEFDKSAQLMGAGNLVVAVSNAVACKMVTRGIPESKLRVVINGVIGSPRLTFISPPPKSLNHPAVIYVGGLHHRKGVNDLIAAFAIAAQEIPGVYLYLVGAGPLRKQYELQAAQHGLSERIIFCGADPDPRSYLFGSDLFILASHAEPAGLVISEARSCGCAVIATHVDGIPEMLDHGRAGLLVPPKRPDLLAAEMIRVLHDETLLAELRKRAIHNIDYFTIERAAKDYLVIYEEALSKA